MKQFFLYAVVTLLPLALAACQHGQPPEQTSNSNQPVIETSAVHHQQMS